MEKKNPEIESKVKICIIIFAVILAVVTAALVIHGKTSGVTSGEKMVEEQTYAPTFKYFVTKSDKNYDEYMKIVKELEKEYDGKVEFEIIDIDEEPEAKENFGDIIALGTPALIMLNTRNEPCAFVGKCETQEQMTATIATALGKE